MVAGSAVVVAGAAAVALNWPAGSTPGARGTEAVADAAAPVAAAQPVSATEPPRIDDGDGKPVSPRLHTVAIAPARKVDVPKRDTRQFSLLGMTWSDADLEVGGTVEVRTRSVRTGRWTGWQTLETEGTQGPDSGAEAKRDLRGGTEPLWVGPSDGVAARVVDAKGTKPLPAGLRLDLVDPGKPAGSSGGQGGGLALEPVPSAPAAAPEEAAADPVVEKVALPAYTSRAGWKAGPAKAAPAMGEAVKAMFVHHTADGSTTYDCKDSAAWVRAIQTYQVDSQGWDDIGYNFLVDRCGALFEGRGGGIDKPVVGAHTYGFNTDTASIAVLGTYSTSGVSDAARKVISQVSAARLTAYGFDPSTTAELTERATDGKFPYLSVQTFPRISGHRDGVATECPGNGLYAQLPAIRVEASARILALKASAPTGGVSSGGKYYVKGKATLAWTTATPSGSIAKFELLVDGKLITTLPATARSGSVTVPSGTHTVQVRGTHVSGAAETTAAATVISDVTVPVLSTPWLGLRTGTVSTTSVPLTVNFKATDNTRVTWIGSTSPTKVTLSPTATTWSTSARPGAAVTFGVSAKDLVGNVSTKSVARATALLPETSAKRTGKWTTKSVSSHLNGKALYSSKKDTKLTFTFTGRSAALVVGRFKTSGKATVYLDGKKVSTIDTKASKTTYRQAIWTRSPAYGKHTVTIVVLATKGRPGVTVDGLAYIK
ncbi:putative N-acetylmuramoyl-L-alanine amidase [Actinoplanes friuliensis DSM 7358]|uniref:Putative N-acetylmuramoyl-L-alanine amidase n=1 Tax=Actinoplanes friuliensis DSM 7358 TaxID=1246995 RepID=U5W2P8_9ACTN|nr:putative N-acetylmuramoyl-L-alanine amidase [Actinoplanes friuliensis DSM 7358]